MRFPQEDAGYHTQDGRISIVTEDGGLTSHILADGEDPAVWIAQNLPGSQQCASSRALSDLANARYEAHYPELVQRRRDEHKA